MIGQKAENLLELIGRFLYTSIAYLLRVKMSNNTLNQIIEAKYNEESEFEISIWQYALENCVVILIALLAYGTFSIMGSIVLQLQFLQLDVLF